MKNLHAILFALCILPAATAVAQQAVTANGNAHIQSKPAFAVGETSPAQQRIAAAHQQLDSDSGKANGNKAQAYNELAIGLIHRARETADINYLKEADIALHQGLKLNSTDLQLERTRVLLMLRCHQFEEARTLAIELNQHTPDDVLTYGYVAEADIAIGNYQEAEEKAQWQMNLRPNNTPALLVGAKLRVLWGDPHGAIEFLNRAYSQTSPIEVEEQAWIANQIASILIDSGRNEDAEKVLVQAGQLFANYPNTIENLARIRMAENRASDAIQLWQQASAMDRNPHLLYELARSQEEVGDTVGAQKTYAAFEKLTTEPDTTTDEAKVDLILLYTTNPSTSLKALKLAEQEMTVRHDIWTLDAYSWSLYTNGRMQEANEAIQKALAAGVQNAQILDHAGHIAQKLNHSAEAEHYFKLAAQINPSSVHGTDTLKSDNQAPAASEPALEQPAFNPNTNGRENLSPSISASRSYAAPDFKPVPTSLLTPQSTATDHQIKNAQASVARNTNDASGYAGLGAAYLQRARETGDVGDYQLAEESLTHSLDIADEDFSSDVAYGAMAAVCMGEHRFIDALKYSQKALSLGTGDMTPFAIIGDAYADMGEYDKAALAYSRLTPRDMTLAPRAAYTRDSRIAYLKFIAGDTPAAIRLMQTAVTEGVEAQLSGENLAWLNYELAEFDTQAGDTAAADAAYLTALNIHPGDYRALAALARLRANNGRFTEAIVLYQRAIAVVPMPIFIAELGDLYAKSGNQTEANKQYALVEYIGLLGHINQVLHNRDLALFYADHDLKLSEALDLARKELEVRHDVYTWDALAWALFKNGKLEEAADASKKALKFGTRDSILLFHAGMIADALGKHDEARSDLQQALQINPHFHLVYAGAVEEKLAAIETESASKEGANHHAL